MSLGGIALAIGMLVDNAIVVLENISRYREQGMPPLEAAKKGASEVSMAITASTLTTVAVFFPLVFVEGVAGQLFKDQALTVTYALLASLLVALTLIPAMAARERVGVAEPVVLAAVEKVVPVKNWKYWLTLPLQLVGKLIGALISGVITLWTLIWRLICKICSLLFGPLVNLVQRFIVAIERGYRRSLKWVLQARGMAMTVTLVVTLACYALIPRLGFDVIPTMSQGEFFVELHLPVGTAIEHTDKALKQLVCSRCKTTPS